MRKSNKVRGAICAALVSALTISGATMTIAPEYAFAATEGVSSEGSEHPVIAFTNEGVSIPEGLEGVTAKGTDVTISATGTYEFTGSCADGSISVKKELEGVTIILNGLTLAKDGDKVIKYKSGSTGTIVVEGTCTLTSSNNKGIIKANALSDDNDNLVFDASGHTTGGDLTIMGTGTLNLRSSYSEYVDGELEGCDGINCEGDLTVLSGTYVIDVTDDALHAENTLTIGELGTAGPSIQVTGATEGFEGASVYLRSGTGTIKTTDDGVNAANADLVPYGWRYAIGIEGGTWNVVAGGDGLDSNGDLTISGGTTEVYCTGSGNGAVDYGEGMEGEVRGTFTTTGGTLLAVGSDMMVTPSSGVYAFFGGFGQGGFGRGGQPGGQQGGPNGQGGQGDFGGQGGQRGQNGALSAQSEQQGQPGQSGQSAVIQAGQATTITTSDGTSLLTTNASAGGSYALFSAPGLTASSELTLKSGSLSTTATTGEGASNPQGMQGQMPQGQGPQGQMQQDVQGQDSSSATDALTGTTGYSTTYDYGTSYDYSTGYDYSTTYGYSTSGATSYTSSSTSTSSGSVTRLSGSTRYDTMAAAVKAAFSSSDWAVVASGEGFADALAASALAGAHKCPVILTSPNALSSQARELIQSLGVSHVQIVGGTAAVSSTVESELATIAGDVTRIAGADRYDTSLKVLDAVRAANGSSSSVIIATGANYADALSIGSWAWNTSSPIVLVPKAGSLSAEARSKLTSAGFTNAVIVGGAAAVSQTVESELNGLNVTRLGGADRYETSRAIAAWTTSNNLTWGSPVFCCGQNFPDALVASALAGKLGSPVLLADATNKTAASLAQTHKSSVNSAYVLGGTTAISADVESSIRSALS